MPVEAREIKIPNHIAIIMDGNGRWAKSKGMDRAFGHKKGAKVFGDIAKYCNKIGVKYLTVYAFSTENWKRPKEEVDSIMDLLRQYLNDLISQTSKEGKIKFIGDLSVLDEDLKELIQVAENKSAENDGFIVNIALNYGGRDEIIYAVKKIADDLMKNQISADDIDEKCISKYLYTENQPDPDLIIRPGGEKRISNFLLWQGAYAELVFLDVLWPDFTSHTLDEAIEIFSERQRRFGGVL
ncbi:MAG: isoprenyl transferase [Oscillospiraceae bacterium]